MKCSGGCAQFVKKGYARGVYGVSNGGVVGLISGGGWWENVMQLHNYLFTNNVALGLQSVNIVIALCIYSIL